MGSLPYALSIHHYISTVGSDAGFAALVGLAILALLYFAQARETSSLREQAAQSAERVQQLEARLTALLQGQNPGAVEATPAPASGSSETPLPDERTIATAGRFSASAPASPSAPPRPARAPEPAAPEPPAPEPAAPEPAAPAGVGAPALAAATRLIPSRVSASSVPAAPRPVTAAATARTEHPIDHTIFVPAASAAGSNGVTRAPVAPAAGYGGGSPPPAPPPRVQIRPGGGGQIGPRPDRPSEAGAQSRPTRQGRRGLVALLVGLLVVGVVVALVAVTSGGGGGGSQAAGKTSTRNRQAARHSTRSIAVNPRSIKIAVLNGTATAGLAHRIAAKLGGGGYSVAATTNAADQTLTTTVVAYTPGQRDAAMAVARSLGLSSAAVQPIDQSTKAIACPPPSACTTTVVVTAGTDLASSA